MIKTVTQILSVPLILTSLVLPVTAAELAAGKEKAGMCATCHGIDGIAKAPNAPNLAGTNAFYITEQLKAFRSGARQHQQMSIIASGLSDEDIADLAAWYSAIKVTATMPAVE
ncbi:c-type cytochrome [Aurantimonas marianensis]|uniref:Cytochrome c n=1 Tax=Aurantimonas marianensis TaxID=2920428 RepID=A0A9X2H518_9HYPH|nr:cytochrome c [Aurantimonas marianensis]MCP3054246.1 cytochrome c [Aurantimonas marianensis]